MSFQQKELLQQIEWAREGDPISQYIIGARLITGNGLDQNSMGGFYWYFRSVKSGYVYAKWNAGAMLVEKDVRFNSGEDCGVKLILNAAEEGLFDAKEFIFESSRFGRFGFSCVDEKSYFLNREVHFGTTQTDFGKAFDLEFMLGVQLEEPILKLGDRFY